jgi:hypothetical protein
VRNLNVFRFATNYFQRKQRICEITPEQRSKIPDYQQKWIKIAQYGIEYDAETIEQAIRDAYDAIGLRPPQVRFFQSPHSLHRNFSHQQENWAERFITGLSRQIDNIFIIWSAMAIFICSFSFFVAMPLVARWFVVSINPLTTTFAISIIISLWIVMPIADQKFFKLLKYLLLMIFVIMLLIYTVVLAPMAFLLHYSPNTFFALTYVIGGCSIGLKHWLDQGWIAVCWKTKVDKQVKFSLHPQIYTQVEQTFTIPSLEYLGSIGKQSTLMTSVGNPPTIAEHRIDSWDWISWCSQVDFCISELGCECERKLWNSIQVLVHSCSTILPREKFCCISDRHTHLRFDEQQRLHAEGKPALAFADGTDAYFIHGIQLPHKYGQLHPRQWRSEWITTETNVVWRGILIEGIGYDRLCQELPTKTIDTWREYSLVWVEVPTPVYSNTDKTIENSLLLIKRTCPNTNFIRALRVLQNTGSAKASAQSVNWDIDLEARSIDR